MFFLSQSGKEITSILFNSEKKWFEGILKELETALGLVIHDYGPLTEEPELVTIEFNSVLQWALEDWKKLFTFEQKSVDTPTKLHQGNWAIIFVARGGLILLDAVENHIENFIWTYFKPKVVVRSHEDISIFEEYQDANFEDKLAEFSDEAINVLFIEDIINTGQNLEAAYERVMEVAENENIEVGEVKAVALISKHQKIGSIPIYGVLVDYDGDLRTAWGNDSPDRVDYRDFTEQKEYVDDHEI